MGTEYVLVVPEDGETLERSFVADETFYSSDIDEIAGEALDEAIRDLDPDADVDHTSPAEEILPDVYYGRRVHFSFDVAAAIETQISDEISNDNGYVTESILSISEELAKAQAIVDAALRSLPAAYESTNKRVPDDQVAAAMARARARGSRFVLPMVGTGSDDTSF